eukprot:TRINITY_DN1096_c0_g2_i1.p1 TRINITY_DN1096_c0_g2~~TRINITY_DN1096_c0_g2_i1.p1  ORF type:complete len:698 (+),score=143.86 TRINITY_DN1096_c0_g2_i1:1026-3119(+)
MDMDESDRPRPQRITIPPEAYLLGNLLDMALAVKEPLDDVYVQLQAQLFEQIPVQAFLHEKLAPQLHQFYSSQHANLLLRSLHGNTTQPHYGDNTHMQGITHMHDGGSTQLHGTQLHGIQLHGAQMQGNTATIRALCMLFSGLATQFPERVANEVLNTLAFATNAAETVCMFAIENYSEGELVQTLSTTGKSTAARVLYLFATLYQRALIVQTDQEFYSGKTFSIELLPRVIVVLKNVLFKALWERQVHRGFGVTVCEKLSELLAALNDRNEQKQFTPVTTFEASDLSTDTFSTEVLSRTTPRAETILDLLPFAIPFMTRVHIFQRWIHAQHDDTLHGMFGVRVPVRRGREFEDAFEQLVNNPMDMKRRWRIQYIDAYGMEEAGIDGGGLTKDFITTALRTGYNPNYGFFKVTTENRLYPNPISGMINPEHLQYFYFIGMLTGKALFEDILAELPFARFFMSKLRGRQANVMDLQSLDPEVYKNLMFLKTYEGNVEDLGLTFAYVDNDLGDAYTVDLIENGRNTAVTNRNVVLYIHLMSNYRLNVSIKPQCDAFLRGFECTVSQDWIKMFSPNDLQILISGTPTPIDIRDLYENTHYGRPYSQSHPTVQMFWAVVAEMSDEERRLLLKFATSCSQPPLLGFGSLQPKFGIIGTDQLDNLPTASTCQNLLKLPAYQDIDVLRQKLLFAISNAQGFELS